MASEVPAAMEDDRVRSPHTYTVPPLGIAASAEAMFMYTSSCGISAGGLSDSHTYTAEAADSLAALAGKTEKAAVKSINAQINRQRCFFINFSPS